MFWKKSLFFSVEHKKNEQDIYYLVNLYFYKLLYGFRRVGIQCKCLMVCFYSAFLFFLEFDGCWRSLLVKKLFRFEMTWGKWWWHSLHVYVNCYLRSNEPNTKLQLLIWKSFISYWHCLSLSSCQMPFSGKLALISGDIFIVSPFSMP